VFHEDSKEHTGHLKSGDIQWMTAGKGVLHAEMPGSWDETSCGF
jgi:redox-sensitive bicupin YhaK (pirin superfamily)